MIGKFVHFYQTIPSTNELAAVMVSKSEPPEGTAISAYHQTDGKGQYGRKWFGQPGQNLYLSVILYPNFLIIEHQFYLSIITALSVQATLSKYIPDTVKIKWPNDIYINDEKVAGILIENVLSNYQIKSSILGIGVNVNQKEFHSLIPNPTSLALHIDTDDKLIDTIKQELFDNLEYFYSLLKNDEYQKILSLYNNLLYLRNSEQRFMLTKEKRIIKATILGVSESGQIALVLNGKQHYFYMGEVQLIL